MILRRLHETDRGIGEGAHEVLQPMGMHDIVRIEDADDLGLGRGALERKPERTRLEALQPVGAHELEPRPQQPAVILDRAPHAWVGRVVDDDHAFEIGPVELRHAVERLPEHLGRLAAGRDMDRDERRPLRQRAPWREQSPGLRAEDDGGKLLDALLHDHDERDEQGGAGEQRDLRAEHEVMGHPIVDDVG